LNQHSNHQADNVIALAKKYYAEVEKAKQGLWMLEGSLFFKCETNPLKMCPTNLCRILPLCGGLVSHLKNKLPSSIHKPCLAFSTSA
jgi:hypothetical protein